ncbi:MAG: hypothetical protein DRJ42_02360 [Deltaproteobacteria bacterium]|nr:MAG: hypothetical protein DRJ42_02360 [Deltaproteobacteria bacterium]
MGRPSASAQVSAMGMQPSSTTPSQSSSRRLQNSVAPGCTLGLPSSQSVPPVHIMAPSDSVG